MIKKNILITGISGFVGSYLAKYLLDQGSNVFGLVVRRADGSTPRNLVDKGIANELKLIEGTLEDISSLAFALDASDPDIIFHLAAQSFVARTFTHPLEVAQVNALGTANLLEVIRMKDLDPIVVFAGSSEEYGLVFSSQKQYERALKKYGAIFPEPEKIPELPINERNPLRPMSPYAVSKVYGDYLMRNYYHSYGMKTVVSRGFNQEGAGRGIMFVTSAIANQAMKLKLGETSKIVIGNVNAFRDWSHIVDVVKGYCLLAEKGRYGDVYNQGSMRTNSVLTYILLALEWAGFKINKIESMHGGKSVENPTQPSKSKKFGISFVKTKIDEMMLNGELEFAKEDKGILVHANNAKIKVEFDETRFRPAEVPILLSDTSKIQKLGFKVEHTLEDIINDQLNYYLKKENRNML